MFVMKTSKTFTHTVKAEIPEGNGKFTHMSLDAEFKRLPEPELAELTRKVNAGELSPPDVVREVMVGWAKVKDEDGNEMTFSAEGLEQLLTIFPMPATITRAFFDAHGRAKAKN